MSACSRSRCRCGRGEPRLGADVEGVSPDSAQMGGLGRVMAQMWAGWTQQRRCGQGRAQSRRGCGPCGPDEGTRGLSTVQLQSPTSAHQPSSFVPAPLSPTLRRQSGIQGDPLPALICTCTGTGSSLPHLHRDWAHPAHICSGTGLTPHSSALSLPHLHRDWGSSPPTSAPGPGSPRPPATSAPGLPVCLPSWGLGGRSSEKARQGPSSAPDLPPTSGAAGLPRGPTGMGVNAQYEGSANVNETVAMGYRGCLVAAEGSTECVTAVRSARPTPLAARSLPLGSPPAPTWLPSAPTWLPPGSHVAP